MSSAQSSVQGLQLLTSPQGIQAVRSFMASGSRKQSYQFQGTILNLKRGPVFWCGYFKPGTGSTSTLPPGWVSVTVCLP